MTEVRNAEELANKESNRIGAVHQELSELGLAVETRTDGLVIRGGQPRAALLKSHGDHRIAMAAAIAANAIDGESTVRGWQAVSSSYPGVRRRPRPRDGGPVTRRARRPRRRDRRSVRDRESRRSRGVLRASSACKCSIPARCTARSRSPRSKTTSTSTTSTACGAVARAHVIAVESGVTTIDGRDVSAEIRGPDSDRRGVVRLRASGGACGARRAAAGVGARARCRSGRGTRHRNRRVPGLAAQGVPDRQRRGAGPPASARRSRVGSRGGGRRRAVGAWRVATRSTAAASRRRCGRPTTRSWSTPPIAASTSVVAELVDRARAAGIA